MIISASRRTDIPAFYSEWFLNRLKERYVLVRSPMNTKMISRIPLDEHIVDCIVFWTKNPVGMLSRLNEIDTLGYKYYFQFTLNAYETSIESNVPKKTEIIRTFKELATMIGSDRVIWRYDPILFTDYYSLDYHIKWYQYLAKELTGYTRKCVISFLDKYKKTERNLRNIKLYEPHIDDVHTLVASMQDSLCGKGISLETCAYDLDLSKYNVAHSSCVDKRLIESLIGHELVLSKDKSQRAECGCIESRDIGSYNTCGHLCKYCYANYSIEQVVNNCNLHNPDSPLLYGETRENDKIVEVQARSHVNYDRICRPLVINDFMDK